VQGFTDHDEDVLLDGLICHANTGLTGSEASARLGLSVGGSEISGALADDALSEADLAAGRYDAAAIEIFLVDWSEPSLFISLSKGTLGEVRREARPLSPIAGAGRSAQPGERATLRRTARPISAMPAVPSILQVRRSQHRRSCQSGRDIERHCRRACRVR
jgi:hypothetical protein